MADRSFESHSAELVRMARHDSLNQTVRGVDLEKPISERLHLPATGQITTQSETNA